MIRDSAALAGQGISMSTFFRGFNTLPGWLLRISYIVAVAVTGWICAVSYLQQKQQGEQLNRVAYVASQITQAEIAMAELAERAKRISAYLPSSDPVDASAAILAGKTLKERKELLKNRPVDPEIVSLVTSLNFFLKQADTAWTNVTNNWQQLGEEVSTALATSSTFVSLDDPFKHHHTLLDPQKINNAKTKSDLHWATRELASYHEIYVKPINAAFVSTLHEASIAQLSSQAKLLERFLFSSVIGMAFLLFLVFIPVDILIGRITGRLAIERRRAEKATARAELADRAKSEFLANMSHEIRTPMNGVMGMAELLARTELDARQHTFVDIIVKSGAALLTIINDILDFSKIDAGQMELDHAPFALAEAIEDVATLVSTRVAEKDLELAVRIDPSLPEMYIGDVGRIRQIITNLLGNAVKFTEKGHVLVDVGGEIQHPQNPGENSIARLNFRIEDTGIGIPLDKQDRLFKKFSQVDGAATRKHEGTGLGLAISKSLIELMGGEIAFESVPDKGTVFHFTIRLPVDGGAVRKRRMPSDVRGARVLVVDDNAVNRAILMEQMQAWHFDAAATASGREAITLLAACHENGIAVDAVILDYHMPEMNGAQTLNAIRDLDKRFGGNTYQALPVIMLTSVEFTEDGRTFSSLGVAAHLTKPARSSMLLESMVAAISENPQRRTNSDASQTLAENTVAPVPARNQAREALEALRSISSLPDANVNAPLAAAQSAQAQVETLPADEIETWRQAISENTPVETTIYKAAPETARPATVAGRVAGRIASSEQLEILIAEDNEVNRIVLEQILMTTGHTYAIVENGKQAIEVNAERKPHIILMDVSMPVMNGLDATRAIRKAEEGTGRHTPIIAVTAHALKGDGDRCFEAGCDDYITKPVSPQRIEDAINKWLPEGQLEASIAS